MTRIEQLISRWLLRRLIRSDNLWESNVIELFEEVNRRYQHVFYEDNYLDRKVNLEESLTKATQITYYD
jgi:hypothetical protein